MYDAEEVDACATLASRAARTCRPLTTSSCKTMNGAAVFRVPAQSPARRLDRWLPVR
jgi:hypothetical protein